MAIKLLRLSKSFPGFVYSWKVLNTKISLFRRVIIIMWTHSFDPNYAERGLAFAEVNHNWESRWNERESTRYRVSWEMGKNIKQRHWTNSRLFLFYGQVIAVLTAYTKGGKALCFFFMVGSTDRSKGIESL